MQKGRFWITALFLLVLFASLFAVGTVYDYEVVWGVGLALFLLTLLMLPAFAIRRKHLSRIDTGEVLVRFSYSDPEPRMIAADILAHRAKQHRAVAILLFVCLAMMGGLFINAVYQGDPSIPLWQLLLLLAPSLLPWIGVLLYRIHLKDQILQYPCETVVGRNFLILANTRPVINERENLQAVQAQCISRQDMLYLRVRYYSEIRIRYGDKIKKYDDFEILVPMGQEKEARATAEEI